ncbi:hypothetical protein PAXINDRAFT_179798 [Paxillus involutus ATCC 200175]|nr:hypothetical protein PAXINDRAFT_179798 [Paxillus involutus ATCC 200175]
MYENYQVTTRGNEMLKKIVNAIPKRMWVVVVPRSNEGPRAGKTLSSSSRNNLKNVIEKSFKGRKLQERSISESPSYHRGPLPLHAIMTPCITLLRESELVDGGKNSERQVMLTWRATDDYKAGDLVDTPMSIPRQGLTYISTCFPSPQRSPPCKLHTERLLFEREAQIQDIAWSVENCQIAIAPGALNFGIAPWNIRSRYASAPFLLDDPSYNPYSKGWKTHKSTCNPHNEIKGIYFAAGESSFRLITVPLEYNHIPDPYSLATDVVKIHILQPLLGDGDHDGLPITHQGKAGKELKHPFRLFIRDNFLNDGSPPNHIPANLTKGKAPINGPEICSH